MSDDEESRADRIRSRRSSRKDRTEQTTQSETSESSEPSNLSKRSKPSEPSKRSKPTVKQEQVGTYMYLYESQKKEIDRLYNVLKAEYEFEFDHEFEKNRHFYPLLVRHGLDGLESLDALEIKERLEDTIAEHVDD